MSGPKFSRRGAIDLSGLRAPAATNVAGGTTASAATGLYSFDVVGEQSLSADVLDRSMSVVILASFWSAASPASVSLTKTMTSIVDDFGGRLMHARIDVGTQPDLAKLLRIPSVPLVVAVLRGQLAPLLQEEIPEAELRSILNQVVQAAVANGVTGKGEPVGGREPADEPPADDSEPPARYPDAEDALMRGDLDAAISQYETALKQAPGDTEATLGLAQAKLLKRTNRVDVTAARSAAAARPDDVAAQSLVADLDLLGGLVEDAFGRLIALVRRTAGDDRDAARKHLVELFGLVGDGDPRVTKARQQLASALF